ncbi:hypothetical protein D4S03_10025 [bacterium]|nr:MAG: hypothetical protein D4S03_10025 [bacterium]
MGLTTTEFDFAVVVLVELFSLTINHTNTPNKKTTTVAKITKILFPFTKSLYQFFQDFINIFLLQGTSRDCPLKRWPSFLLGTNTVPKRKLPRARLRGVGKIRSLGLGIDERAGSWGRTNSARHRTYLIPDEAVERSDILAVIGTFGTGGCVRDREVVTRTLPRNPVYTVSDFSNDTRLGWFFR